MKWLRRIGTLGLYFLIPGLSAVTPLLVLPALTATHGASGLAVLGVAQSFGATAAVIADLGWGVLGPQKIARSGSAEKSQLYSSAAATRLSALALLAPMAAIASYIVVSEDTLDAAVIALGFSTAALSPSWYLIGCNRPLTILWVEGVPRILASVVCAAALFAGAPLMFYGFALLLSAAMTWWLSALATGNQFWPRLAEFRRGRTVVRQHLPLTLGRTVSVIYTTLPIAIVAIAAPSATPVFTAVERLMRMALSLLGGFPSRLQSWVGQDKGSSGQRRSQLSLIMNTVVGLIAGVGFAFLAPVVANFVFSGVVDLTIELTAIAGASILAICASRGFGLSLVAAGKGNWIALANIVAAMIGVPAVLLLSSHLGAAGGLLGELLAESFGLGVQAAILFGALAWLKRRRKK